ncbi:nickel/cobalt transporter [Streptomyces sp. H27-D2]|uniref:nickel/cobalt transporter n=1 Tax=Streptomyces sp. H27-D2 TaxID=3046304 RepID=UPI002DB69A44|nr:sulfite exporter TauE/SafE family protein [Streptomyces sp. H27-D2]MEC4019129.1 sulfite exporter TauE/SafE family protein [Streptomyces sp. H27-D2]
MIKTPRRALPLMLTFAAAVLCGAPVAEAHPLGNFTVNHYDGFRLYRDRIEVSAVVDRAEIAAAQERPAVDTDHNGTVTKAERAAHAQGQCADLRRKVTAQVNGEPSRWRVTDSTFVHRPGEAGLTSSRLHCELTAPADLEAPATVVLADDYDGRRIGWHEMTARGTGVELRSPPLPTTSVSDELRRYPQDLLADPLDQRTATFDVAPASGGSAPVLPPALPGAGPVSAALAHVTALFDSLVGTRHLTLSVGLLALLLSLVLGASHAAMPGHGKTIMAAYLAGKRGSVRDAITVGATVTFTHTAGVLILGFTLPFATHLAGESVLAWLGVASGLLVSAIGIGLLRNARAGHAPGHHHHGHGHGHHHHPHPHGAGHQHTETDHLHEHPQEADFPQPSPARLPRRRRLRATPAVQTPGPLAVLTEPAETDSGHPAHRRAHEHPATDTPAAPNRSGAHDHQHPARRTRRGLIGVGIAGGLVPSPSALVVLLGAIALGRTAFGILLVLGYGLGMALTLTAAGIALVRFRDAIADSPRLQRLAGFSLLARLNRWGPTLTACLVLAVGAGLTARALSLSFQV